MSRSKVVNPVRPATQKTKKLTHPPPRSGIYSPRDKNERRKQWVKDAAAGFIRMPGTGIQHEKAKRDAQVFAAVETATAIWTMVEGRFMEGPEREAP